MSAALQKVNVKDLKDFKLFVLNESITILDLPDNIRESAVQLYKKCMQVDNSLKHLPNYVVSEAIIYATCVRTETPMTFDKILRLSMYGSAEVLTVFNRVVKCCDSSLKIEESDAPKAAIIAIQGITVEQLTLLLGEATNELARFTKVVGKDNLPNTRKLLKMLRTEE